MDFDKGMSVPPMPNMPGGMAEMMQAAMGQVVEAAVRKVIREEFGDILPTLKVLAEHPFIAKLSK